MYSLQKYICLISSYCPFIFFLIFSIFSFFLIFPFFPRFLHYQRKKTDSLSILSKDILHFLIILLSFSSPSFLLFFLSFPYFLDFCTIIGEKQIPCAFPRKISSLIFTFNFLLHPLHFLFFHFLIIPFVFSLSFSYTLEHPANLLWFEVSQREQSGSN